MRLLDLEPSFLRHAVETAGPHHGRPLPDGTTQWGGFDTDVFYEETDLARADGVEYLCPLCFQKNGGAVGTHSLHTYFAGRGVPDHLGKDSNGQTVRWTIVSGSGLHDLTLSPSILVKTGCGWHGFITNGEIITC